LPNPSLCTIIAAIWIASVAFAVFFNARCYTARRNTIHWFTASTCVCSNGRRRSCRRTACTRSWSAGANGLPACCFEILPCPSWNIDIIATIYFCNAGKFCGTRCGITPSTAAIAAASRGVTACKRGTIYGNSTAFISDLRNCCCIYAIRTFLPFIFSTYICFVHTCCFHFIKSYSAAPAWLVSAVGTRIGYLRNMGTAGDCRRRQRRAVCRALVL